MPEKRRITLDDLVVCKECGCLVHREFLANHDAVVHAPSGRGAEVER